LVLIAGGLWFWIYLLGNPINELALIRHGVTAKGVIKDVSSSYEFRLPNGQMVKGKTGEITYYMPESGVEVEYLPDNPAVSRIKGDGCSTVTGWLWRNVGLLILFFSPGVGLIFWGAPEAQGVILVAHTKDRAFALNSEPQKAGHLCNYLPQAIPHDLHRVFHKSPRRKTSHNPTACNCLATFVSNC